MSSPLSLEGVVHIVKLLGKISDFLDAIASIVTVILVAFLSVLIFAAVLWRYVLNNPITWQYEVTLVCLSWVIFIGMSMTFKHKEHMSLTFITNRLKSKVKVVWLDVIDLVCIAFLVMGIITSISIVQNTWSQMYMTVALSRGLFYLSFPIGAFISIVHLVYHILTRDVSSVDIVSMDEKASPVMTGVKGE